MSTLIHLLTFPIHSKTPKENENAPRLDKDNHKTDSMTKGAKKWLEIQVSTVNVNKYDISKLLLKILDIKLFSSCFNNADLCCVGYSVLSRQ